MIALKRAYRVSIPGEPSVEVRAFSAGRAAEAWLRTHNEDGRHTDGDELELRVGDPSVVVTRWSVSATTATKYTAKESK